MGASRARAEGDSGQLVDDGGATFVVAWLLTALVLFVLMLLAWGACSVLVARRRRARRVRR